MATVCVTIVLDCLDTSVDSSNKGTHLPPACCATPLAFFDATTANYSQCPQPELPSPLSPTGAPRLPLATLAFRLPNIDTPICHVDSLHRHKHHLSHSNLLYTHHKHSVPSGFVHAAGLASRPPLGPLAPSASLLTASTAGPASA